MQMSTPLGEQIDGHRVVWAEARGLGAGSPRLWPEPATPERLAATLRRLADR